VGHKLADELAYPPRGLRVERAAAYVGISKTTFLQMVEDGTMPKPKRHKSIVVWDRLALDTAFEALGGDDRDDQPRLRENTFDKILGVKTT
jgi:predicted DNA-binding transcriptional regulator AlpA